MKFTRSVIARFLAGKGCRLRLWIGLSYRGGAKEHGRKRDCAPPVYRALRPGVNVYRLSDREADPLSLAIDTDWVFPWTTTWMLPPVLYWELKNVPA
jgi:hypothetical protein